MSQAIFQSFEQKTKPSQGAPHLKALREEMKRRGLDGFIVPRTDEHQKVTTESDGSVAIGMLAVATAIQTMPCAPHPIGISATHSRPSGIRNSAISPSGMVQKAVSGTAIMLDGMYQSWMWPK